jgi:Ion channel
MRRQGAIASAAQTGASMDALYIVLGVLLVVWVLADIFFAVLVPRPVSVSARLSVIYIRSLWPYWRSIGLAMRNMERRDSFLGMFAPFALITLLALWEACNILGFGLIDYGMRAQIKPALDNFGEAVYFAGTAFTTIGFGDFVAMTLPARMTSIVAGALGLSIVAVVLTFLFSIISSFQRREVRVAMTDARAGAPPSGVAFLVSYAELDIRSHMSDSFIEMQRWIAEILDSHLSYPILFYFRSTHDNASWIAALGAMLDAATLLITTVDGESTGQAALLIELGTHATHDFADFFNMQLTGTAGVERREYDDARARLAAAGYTLRDAEPSWKEFCDVRKRYSEPLNNIARYWAIPPAQWVGDRSSLRHHSSSP